MDKCDKCGCPTFEIGIISHIYHYKSCPIVKDAYQARKVSLREVIAIARSWITLETRQLRQLEKAIVIDEVYECRWDCCSVPG